MASYVIEHETPYRDVCDGESTNMLLYIVDS